MREEYTAATARALQLAQHTATSRGAVEVEPVDLFRALLAEEEGRPFVLLREAGAAAERLQEWTSLSSLLSTGAKVEAPFSGDTETALTQARHLARDIALDPTVSSEQVLLALLWQDAELRQSVQEIGVDLAALENRVLAGIAGPSIALDEPLQLDDLGESVDTARVLDAGANRAREALRVLEDYCRFTLDDAFLSHELKDLRHRLAGTLAMLPTRELLVARDTLGDVGTKITTEDEGRRYSLRDVAQVNFKRLEEALRSLEEFGKLVDATLSQELEQLRYRSYTLERMLVGENAAARLARVRLYFLLTGAQCYGTLEWTVREAIDGGVQMIQLREKGLTDRELWERARQVRRWTRDSGALFVVNDRPDLARLTDADGVHLGQDDLTVKEARRIVGTEALIGVSCHSLEQVQSAAREGASYIGVGPTFASDTKEFGTLAGVEFVRAATAETSLPAFVIGGVNLKNLPEVLAAGGKRIAVSGALCRAEAPQALAAALRRLLDAAQ